MGNECSVLNLVYLLWLFPFAPLAAPAQDIDRLLADTAIVRAMDEKTLVALVPLQSGLFFVGCPNCDRGRQEQQLTWTIKRPHEVMCRFCGQRYPSDEYPMHDAVVVRNPRGEPTRFEYWADENGYRYFFKARRDDEVRKYLARQTLNLTRLHAATGDTAHAHRAAILLDRFAQVFPGWCYHFDYPFRQKQIYDGEVAPQDYRSGFRTARWNWWAYHDIPLDLVETFRLLRDSGVFEELSSQRGVDVAKHIEQDLLRNAGEQVFANRDNCTNMSPSAWRSLVKLGSVVGEPRYRHEVVRRFRRLIELRFFYDGFWYEGTPSYAQQTISSLNNVLQELQDDSDPTRYVDPTEAERSDNSDLNVDLAILHQAQQALDKMRLPNGRFVPVHDTWADSEPTEPVASRNSFLLPALGHACLTGGTGAERSELHLSWSGGYGHQHADMLSLLLYSQERELLSDLGYSHTAFRSWTIATASHNTVVIDGVSQAAGSQKSPTDGRLQLADFTNPRVQVISVDGTRAYAAVAKNYRRTVIFVEAGHQCYYAVDVFEVDGGTTHDYFLHGNADEPAHVVTTQSLSALPTLLPAGFDWKPTMNEGQSRRAYEPHYPYGFLRNLHRTDELTGGPVHVDFQNLTAPHVGVRAVLWPEPNSELVLGENPSIRLAQEDDSQLDKSHRPFMMLRHRAEDGRSSFVTILEPYRDKPKIDAAKRVGNTGDAVILQLQIGDRIDIIAIGAKKEQAIPIGTGSSDRALYRGAMGLLTLRNGEVEHAYSLGEGGWRMGIFKLTSQARQQSSLVRTEPGALVVAGEKVVPPAPGDVIRLLTADCWVYPFNVQSAAFDDTGRLLRIEVAEGPGMNFDKKQRKLRLRSFPQREHAGQVYVEWQSSANWERPHGS